MNSDKKQIRLSKKAIEHMINESIQRKLKSMGKINEGTTFSDSIEKWDYLKETVGAETMLDAIYAWSSSDQIDQWLEWFEEEGYFYED